MFEVVDDFGRYTSPGLTFTILYRLSMVFERSEPKDGVFAVLAMLPEGHIIAVDYSQDLRQILKRATRRVIAEGNNLHYLDGTHHNSSDFPITEEMPSWILRADQSEDGMLVPDQFPSYWSACNGFDEPTRLISHSQNSAILTVEGVLLNKVR